MICASLLCLCLFLRLQATREVPEREYGLSHVEIMILAPYQSRFAVGFLTHQQTPGSQVLPRRAGPVTKPHRG